MDAVHVVVSEPRRDVHTVKMHYVLSISKNDLDKVKNHQDCEFHGSFDTKDEAQTVMKQTILDNTKEYTKQIHDSGLPDKNNLSKVNSRALLAYLGNDLTISPNIYKISVYEFIVLKENYPLTRLASLDEILNTNTNDIVIPMTQETWNAVGKLQLLDLPVSLSNDPVDIQNIDKAYRDIHLNIFKLITELQIGQTENIDRLLKQLMPDEDPTMIEQVKTALNQIVQFAKAGREEGLTDLELEKRIFTDLIHIENEPDDHPD